MRPLLQVSDLTVRFYTKDGVVQAVNGVSYEMAEGDILGLVGESGSGKSVSSMAMLRLIPEPPGRIENGQVLFDGRDLLRIGRNRMHQVRGREIGVIFQDPMTSLNPVMPIGRQIAEAMEVNLGTDSRQAQAEAVRLLERVGIPQADERVNDYPHQFSGGMRQRVMIAMAISCKPKLLIADEPTTALDVTIQAQIVDLVRQLQEELGMAIIWITHDLGVIARLARRVNVMYAGTIVETAPIKPLFRDPAHPYTLGLLRSLPSLETTSEDDLEYIEGAPPDMINLPPGCPFWPRCAYRTQVCTEKRPKLFDVADGHQSACWHIDRVLKTRSPQARQEVTL
ncbi:MAG: ABC transporter ATP-binding protein [Anaerolineae bacterium]|nr:ABC transporter ATP-binding protein [Anaerolineae bacterium]